MEVFKEWCVYIIMYHCHLFYHQNAKSLGACTMCILLFISICKYAFSLLCMKGQAFCRHIAVRLAEVQHMKVGKYKKSFSGKEFWDLTIVKAVCIARETNRVTIASF